MPNFDLDFGDAAPAATSNSPLRITVRPFNRDFDPLTSAPPPAPPSGMNAPGAVVAGVRQGATLNLSDELLGLSAAGQTMVPEAAKDKLRLSPLGHIISAAGGLGRLGYEALTTPSNTLSTQITGPAPRPALKAYEAGRDEERGVQAEAAKEYPMTHLGSTVAGSVIAPAAAIKTGAALGGRAAAGAVTAGSTGVVAGAGAGEDAQSRALGGAIGGLIGVGTGAAIPLGADLMKWVAKTTHVDKIPGILRGAWNLDKEAQLRIGEQLVRDAQSGSGGISGPVGASTAPIANIDAAGNATRDLARNITNASGPARNVMEPFLAERFAGQAGRAESFVRGLSPLGGRSHVTLDDLKQTARVQNSPAYKVGYAAGDKPIWSPELETLAGSDAVHDAMKAAVKTGKDRAIVDNLGAFNPGVKVTPDGRLEFHTGPKGVPTYPNIQYWDYVQRELGDAITKAKGRGEAGTEEVARLSQLQTRLRNELDTLVPEFGVARKGAATFFKADNMVDAGKNFATMEMGRDEARAAIAKMKPAEHKMFQEGFVSDIADRVAKSNDRADITSRMYSSPDARDRIRMALGPLGALKLEMHLRTENIMDMARKAVMGNSTTARQAMNANVGGIGPGISSAAIGGVAGIADAVAFGGDWKAIVTSALTGAAAFGVHKANDKLATRMAEMLVSNDHALMQKAFDLAATNREAGTILRSAERSLQKALGYGAGTLSATSANEK